MGSKMEHFQPKLPQYGATCWAPRGAQEPDFPGYPPVVRDLVGTQNPPKTGSKTDPKIDIILTAGQS